MTDRWSDAELRGARRRGGGEMSDTALIETLCKLTHPNLTTHGGHQWTPGKWHETSGEGQLCGPGWIHLYHHPLIAEWMDPIHGGFGEQGILWRVEVEGDMLDDRGLKLGVTRLRLTERMERREFPLLARVRAAILVAYPSAQATWMSWADRWLSGKDRSSAEAEAWAEAAAAAAAAAEWAAWAARSAARSAVEEATFAAAEAAERSAWSKAAVIAEQAIREEAALRF